MYYPYFRGKQFELLAIKQFAATSGSGARVAPVIEAVRDPTANGGFERAVREMIDHSMRFTLIVNPQVGHLAPPNTDAAELIIGHMSEWDIQPSDIRLGLLLSSPNLEYDASAIANSEFSATPCDLFYPSSTPPESSVENVNQLVTVGNHFASGKDIVRRYRNIFETSAVVRFSDPFPSQPTNVKYVHIPESVFTDHHLFFNEDKYVGFSDYATIGDQYSEGGSSPRAVVIHFTYENVENGAIYVRHFSSDTNEDTSDTAGKFAEAVQKLISFVEERELENPAILAFRAYGREGKFPGLGMVKKLSILNHMYLVDGILSRQT